MEEEAVCTVGPVLLVCKAVLFPNMTAPVHQQNKINAPARVKQEYSNVDSSVGNLTGLFEHKADALVVAMIKSPLSW